MHIGLLNGVYCNPVGLFHIFFYGMRTTWMLTLWCFLIPRNSENHNKKKDHYTIYMSFIQCTLLLTHTECFLIVYLNWYHLFSFLFYTFPPVQYIGFCISWKLPGILVCKALVWESYSIGLFWLYPHFWRWALQHPTPVPIRLENCQVGHISLPPFGMDSSGSGDDCVIHLQQYDVVAVV